MSGPRCFKRVLVLGMDGLDPRLVGQLAQSGRLASFSRLKELGYLGTLATSNPAESPVAWSSLATGCNPGKHGIFDFIHRRRSNYAPFLSILRERETAHEKGTALRFACPRGRPGFWQLTSQAGMPTSVIRWPVTFPAEAVRGNFLAGLGVPDVTGRLGKYMYYTTSDKVPADEKVVHLPRREGTIRTYLNGPSLGFGGFSRSARCKLTIERRAHGAVLSIGSQRQEISPGRWSDWFTLRFKWGPLSVCHAQVKFHLVQAHPDLHLFATPAQIDPDCQLWPLTAPATYGKELTAAVGPYYTLGLPEDTHAVTDGRYDLDAFLQQCAEIHSQRRRMFEYELGRFREGVLAFVFDAGDRIQHMFWSIDDPQSPVFDPKRAKAYRHVIPDLYREMDAVLATALQAVDEDTAVFVLSDHGFGPFHRAVHLNRWLIEQGHMKLKAAGVGGSLFADVDWSHTRAYAVGFTSIYLNLAGREGQGVVSNGQESAKLLQDIAAALNEARDPQSGARFIRRVYPAADIYCGSETKHGPDLVVGYEPGYRASWQTALGGAPSEIVVDNDKLWAADHLVDPTAVPGTLATNVRPVASRPTCVDLAPTVLTCLGLPVPRYMDGQSWTSPSVLHPQSRAAGWSGFTPEPSGVEQDQRDHAALMAKKDNDGVGQKEPRTVVQVEAAPATSVAGRDSHDGLSESQRARLEQHLSDLGYL